MSSGEYQYNRERLQWPVVCRGWVRQRQGVSFIVNNNTATLKTFLDVFSSPRNQTAYVYIAARPFSAGTNRNTLCLITNYYIRKCSTFIYITLNFDYLEILLSKHFITVPAISRSFNFPNITFLLQLHLPSSPFSIHKASLPVVRKSVIYKTPARCVSSGVPLASQVIYM